MSVRSRLARMLPHGRTDVLPLPDTTSEVHQRDGFHGWVNRVNRLIRPALLVLIVALFVWPIWQPEQFQAWAMAVALIPENLWVLILMIVGSFATTKAFRDFRARTQSGTRIDLGQSNGYGGYGMNDYISPDLSNPRIDAWRQSNPLP